MDIIVFGALPFEIVELQVALQKRGVYKFTLDNVPVASLSRLNLGSYVVIVLSQSIAPLLQGREFPRLIRSHCKGLLIIPNSFTDQFDLMNLNLGLDVTITPLVNETSKVYAETIYQWWNKSGAFLGVVYI